MAEPGITAAALPLSSLSVPLTLDLTTLPEVLEHTVPSLIETPGAWTLVAEGRVGIRYRAWRAPFSLSFQEESLRASTQMEYEAEGCFRRKPWFFESATCAEVTRCGREDEPRRRLHIAGSSRLAWTPEWHLAARTAFQLGHPQRCRLTFLDYDVTSHIEQVLSGRLALAAAELDARIAAHLDARGVAEQLWRAASVPIPLQSSAWLLLSPKELRVSPLRGSGLALSTSLVLLFQPSVVLGPRPTVASAPLPPLKVGPPTEGLHLNLEARIPFEEATRLLGEQLPRRCAFQGLEVEIRKAQVSGGKGLARFKVSAHILSGLPTPTDVTLWLRGRPRYDPPTRTLVLDGLDYTPESSEALVKQFDLLVRPQLSTCLRQQVRSQVEGLFNVYRRSLEAAFEQLALPQATSLRAPLKDIRPLDITTTEGGFRVVFEASGEVVTKLTLSIPGSE
ncbi:DUF4403 family protein [Corallococcus llansteffanensis]|nr:DUF4403 family protein [Corallococcus llansteffanensis]